MTDTRRAASSRRNLRRWQKKKENPRSRQINKIPPTTPPAIVPTETDELAVLLLQSARHKIMPISRRASRDGGRDAHVEADVFPDEPGVTVGRLGLTKVVGKCTKVETPLETVLK